MSIDLSDFDPAPSQGIGSGAPLRFSVTGTTTTYALIVEIDGVRQLAWDGTEFAIPFAGQSSRAAIPGGYRYTLRRNDGRWPLYPSIIARPLEGGSGLDPAIVEAIGELSPSDFEALGDLPEFATLPTANTAMLRDGSGIAYATGFYGPADGAAILRAQAGRAATVTGETNAVVTAVAGTAALTSLAGAATMTATGATSDATITAGRDVIVGVGSTSDEVAIKAGDVTKATITPGASTVTVATATDVSLSLAALGTGVAQLEGAQAKISATAGAAATLRADGGTVVVGDGDEPDALTITPNGSGGTTTIAAFQPMSISAAGTMTVQPAQATSGAGPKLTIGGGPGQTSGTHLAGVVDIDQGTTVSNVSAATNFVANGTTRLSIIASVINGAFSQILQAGARGLLVDATDTGGSLLARANSSLLLRVYQDSVINLLAMAATRARRMLSNESTTLNEDFGFAVVVAASGSAQLATWSIPTNTSVTATVICTVANRTNKRTSSFHRRFVAQNDAGSGNDNGADVAVVADSIGAGEAGLTVTLDRSGTTLRLNRNTPDADSREFRGIVLIHFSSLT